ncbi:MAG: rhodanese-like domain-containing protein, partial [Gammaproteobacteria bacterium]
GDADDAAGLYVRSDGFLQDPAAIRALWTERGILHADGSPTPRELVFSCGGGWRSSLACLYAAWLGIPHFRNHSGGWSEWSTRFRRDPRAGPPSPGWRQSASGNL